MDELYLKSGKILRGVVYKQDEEYYHIRLGNKKVRVKREKVEKAIMGGKKPDVEDEFEVIEETP